MGRYDLGLSEDEFWELTLKELNALVERHESNHGWLNYRAALICSIIANSVPHKGDKIFTYADFMPKMKPRKSKPQTAEQMLATVKMLHAAYGEKVTEE